MNNKNNNDVESLWVEACFGERNDTEMTVFCVLTSDWMKGDSAAVEGQSKTQCTASRMPGKDQT